MFVELRFLSAYYSVGVGEVTSGVWLTTRWWALQAKVSIPEEPDAEKLHVGMCGEGIG